MRCKITSLHWITKRMALKKFAEWRKTAIFA